MLRWVCNLDAGILKRRPQLLNQLCMHSHLTTIEHQYSGAFVIAFIFRGMFGDPFLAGLHPKSQPRNKRDNIKPKMLFTWSVNRTVFRPTKGTLPPPTISLASWTKETFPVAVPRCPSFHKTSQLL
jgi:hypothetical protein